MLDQINLPLILAAHIIASCSPGPATLTIAGTSMAQGRIHGLCLAGGVAIGSMLWSVSAALGLASIMHANAWFVEIMRYVGAAYLLYLGNKSARSAFATKSLSTEVKATKNYKKSFMKGFLLHLTNPKAVFFFGALYSIGVPAGTEFQSILLIIIALGVQACVIFLSYAMLFSNATITKNYLKLRRYLEGLFAFAFGFAAFKIFTSKL